jgi:ABC-type glycerol-3-phosphate transport system substrate-binding protein
MTRTLAALLLALVLAGCGGDDEEGAAPTEPTTTAAAPTRCEPATVDLTAPLANGLTVEGARLTKAFLVQSSQHDGIFFVSAEIDGPGYEDAGDVATWASTSRFGGDLLYAVDDLANELGSLRDGREVAGLAMDDDGVAESRSCAGA